MREPNTDDVDEVIELIDDELPWAVTSWQSRNGGDETASLTLELEWREMQTFDEDATKVRVETLSTIRDAGDISHEDLIHRVSHELDVPDGTVEFMIQELKQKGEIYEPTDEHYRVV